MQTTPQPISDVILIRHGQSEYNRGYLDYIKLHNLQHNWDHCYSLDDFNQKVSYAKQHIDCHLTPQGVQQCLKAKKQLQNVQIDLVLVSPHQRALQTCREILGHRDILIQVHPVICQVFRYACDINSHIDQKMKQFSKYDFTHMKDRSQLWFIQNLAQHHKDTCQLHIQQSMTFAQKQAKMLELIKSKVIFESPQELKERVWKVKSLLGEYRKKYKRIAVVSHYWIIRYLIAESFQGEGEPGPQFIENAKPLYKNVQKMLKFK